MVRRPVRAARPVPVVGVGASAGGLEALEKFFAHVAPDCGMAFVVVTHQHPGHTSLLPELLRKCTRMRVQVAVDGVAVEPGCVFMSPPEGYLAILNGTLHLMEPDEPGPLRLPIDYFFRSLAEDQKEKAIGIVLSGTGTDGTLGLKAIKGAAGMTMAQAPESAKYSGMPSSAIATGLVDYVLPTEQIPAQLGAYAQGPYLGGGGHAGAGRRPAARADAEDQRAAARPDGPRFLRLQSQHHSPAHRAAHERAPAQRPAAVPAVAARESA